MVLASSFCNMFVIGLVRANIENSKAVSIFLLRKKQQCNDNIGTVTYTQLVAGKSERVEIFSKR